MSQSEHKRAAAAAALELVRPLLAPGAVLGVGTGSTANFFIDALANAKLAFDGAVSSSAETTARLRRHGIPVLELNAVETVAAYVDGADEVAPDRTLVKGGGGALTREKIVASAAERFVCIVDESKLVAELGAFPLPVEVLPVAQRLVLGALGELGGQAAVRRDCVTDQGNHIVDVRGLATPAFDAPEALEQRLNAIPGVVENGIFALHRPQQVLVGGPGAVALRE